MSDPLRYNLESLNYTGEILCPWWKLPSQYENMNFDQDANLLFDGSVDNIPCGLN